MDLAAAISKSIEQRGVAEVTFICTHNSRRSQFSQAWPHASIDHVGLGDKVRVFSGGTESTACNPRTIASLKPAGFEFDVAGPSKANPRYSAVRPDLDSALVLFSKVYDQSPNPNANFIAVVCCGDADQRCPAVAGATDRIALHYVDPKVADDTPQEASTYDERCMQIGSEMLSTALKVDKHLQAQE